MTDSRRLTLLALILFFSACEKPEYTGEQYMMRGVIMVEQDNIDQALKDFNAAIELDPKLEEAFRHRAALYFGRGLALKDREAFAAAIEDFTRAIELEPYNPNAYYFRGDAFRMVKQFADARADWQAACDMRNTTACVRLKRPITAD